MEDDRIIGLYWERDPQAIPATEKKYGGYCMSIARNILNSREDAEECVSDTFLRAWRTMPPHRPARLSAFLGRITRHLSLNRLKREQAQKRGGGELPAVLDELAECVSGGDVEGEVDRRELARAIDDFLDTLPPEKRGIFVSRYWYADSIGDIAMRYRMKPGTVSMMLSRLREKLWIFLTERGFDL